MFSVPAAALLAAPPVSPAAPQRQPGSSSLGAASFRPGRADVGEPRTGGKTLAGEERFARSLLVETNRVRRARGRRAVAPSADLARAAAAHAESMRLQGFFSHVSPQGTEPADRVRRLSPRAIVLGVRENIMKTDDDRPPPLEARARRVVERWMSSKGHRENLLSEETTHVGFGISTSQTDGTLTEYMVQVLGIVAGFWRETPDLVADTPVSWEARLFMGIEMFLEDEARPHRSYRDPSRRAFVWKGGVPLTVSTRSGRSRVEFPGLEAGPYRLLARLGGESGYQTIGKIVVAP